MKKAIDAELLIKHCEPLPGDDEELLNCPFVYEYEDTPQSSPSVAVTASEPTGILMLSVSSTDSDGRSSPHENEEFATPPEQNNSSQPYFSGSDEQKPGTSAGVDTDAVNHDNQEAVDLGNDFDELGFSNRREIGVHSVGEFEQQLRKRYKISEEDLGGTKSVPRKVKEERIVIEIDQTQTQEVDTEVVGEFEQQLRKRYKISEEDLGGTKSVPRKVKEEPIVIEIDQTQSQEVDTEVVVRGIKRNADSSIVKMPERGEEEGDGGDMRENVERVVDDNEKLNGVGTGEMHSTGITDGVGDGEIVAVNMNLDENEKLNGVCMKEMHSNGITTSVGVDGGGGSVKGRRELPLSIRGGDKNVGSLEEVGRRATNNGSFKDLVDAFSMVIGDVSADDQNAADFLETAKRRGLSFPRPRWWPPEGFAD